MAGQLVSNYQQPAVDLACSEFAPVQSIYVNWASAVASSFSVIPQLEPWFRLRRIEMPNVNISTPYNHTEQSVVQPYQSNATNINVAHRGVWTGRYATLTVAGNQGDECGSAPGASVAEWAIVV